MKRIIKCGTAFLLALVLCLCLLPTTAFAASNQVYIWNFPLSDDTLKSSGNWGHGVLDLRFGYRVGASSYTQFRCLDSWQGEVAYCIEPGAPQKNYDSLTDHNDTWWDHLTLPDGHPLTPREVQRLIGRIMSYGYHGTIGGVNTNCVIAGHRGWYGADYFRHIDRLQAGDMVTVTNLWETLTYTVVDIQIIQPDQVNRIKIQPGRDLLTLITCHPYASGGRQRLVVYCERRK